MFLGMNRQPQFVIREIYQPGENNEREKKDEKNDDTGCRDLSGTID
jgi:hypothetical protein